MFIVASPGLKRVISWRCLAIAFVQLGIVAVIGASQGSRVKWASSYATLDGTGCDHKKVGAWYGLWRYGEVGCSRDSKGESYSGDYANREAYDINRISTNVLLVVGLVCVFYYSSSGCCCGRSQRFETLAAVFTFAAGLFAVFGAGHWWRPERRLDCVRHDSLDTSPVSA